MSVPTMPAPERLRTSADIAAVFAARRSRAGRLMVLHARDRRDASDCRAAVVASRRVGTAVRRNRAKRLLREAARRVAWRPGLDVVVVARAASAGSGLTEVHDELARLATDLDLTDPAGDDQARTCR